MEMSKRELGRVEVLARVRSKQLRVVDAARLMRVSYWQAKRLWKRYREEGAAGLQHRSAARPSNRAYEQKFRQKVLRLVREKYGGQVGERFGPTLATEHLGEMVQVDGSFHSWLEERGPEGCLIDMVDDATNTTWAQLGQQETSWAVADALRAWIERYGVPLALYVDWKNLYKRPATPKERLRGEEPITQFGRMCAKLGIEVIAANSPQAKGRVERIHGTHQDRLVKKLRRKEISSHQHANLYLEREYLAEHNRRFARTPARLEDYHRRAPRATEMDRIFRLESERTISADWVVRYDNRFFQLQPQSRHYAPGQGKVLVCEGRYGRIAIEYQGRALRWQEIPAPAKPSVRAVEPALERTTTASLPRAKRKWVPPADHPWREAARRWAQQKASRQAATPPRPSLALPCASP